ncbi:MAG: YezD family protein [Oscillospiraceae bacterium]|nr:YezD family protein [Oscillospiraceae bacterium]
MSKNKHSGNSGGPEEIILTDQERELIKAVRKLGSGEERVVVKDSKIVQIEESKPTDGSAIPLTVQEQKIIEIVRGLDYGEERVVVRDSEIVQIEEKKSIKL